MNTFFKFASLASLTIAGLAVAEPRELTFVADPWCPYNCEPGDANAEGFLIELAKAALEPLGYKITYKQVSWDDAIPAVRKGTYDVLVASDPEESPGFVFSNHYAPCGYALFSRKGEAFTYHGPNSLGDRKLGGVEGYYYGQAEADYINSNLDYDGKVQLTSGTAPLEDNVGKMLNGRIDVMLENPAVLNYYLHSVGKDGTLVKTADTLKTPCHLAFSPAKTDSASIAKAMDDRLPELESSGFLPALRKKYGLDYISTSPKP
ncbi:MAG: transporter substrate-binding domain-containing protein [Alphaproteobacteria bacterium]